MLAGPARTSVGFPSYHVLILTCESSRCCTSYLYFPLPQLAWHKVSDLRFRTVIPVHNALRTTLRDDIEGLAQLFVDLEVTSKRESQTYLAVSFHN